MSSQIKNEVLTLVQTLEDENLLRLLKADIEYLNGYTKFSVRI